MAEKDQNVEAWVGNKKTLQITVRDSLTLQPKNITGAAAIRWSFAAARGGSPRIVEKSLGSGVAITDGPGGVLQVTLDPADTALVAPGIYYHEAQVAMTGTNYETCTEGRLLLNPTNFD